MLKSLFSGVSGLQSHQVAMDIESNNIANVNTVGFKYSRANFADLLAQTKAVATAPQGELGGKNPLQVGLGTSVSSMTRIFSQGSIQNSDKNTDVAIQGDGFFIISPDGGNTYKYTRNGDFKFDAGGNFVDNNGFIVQGWLRDPITGKVDATAPITNINIPPGLTTPASATKQVVLKANLNSGPLVQDYSPAYKVPAGAALNPPALDANGNPIASDDMGVVVNEVGEALNLQKNQGVWVSFASTKVVGAALTAAEIDGDLDLTFELDNGDTVNITSTGSGDTTIAQTAARFVSAINAKSSVTGITATFDSATNQLSLVNQNNVASASHNIRMTVGGTDDSGFVDGDTITSYRYQYDPTGSNKAAGTDKTFTTMADLREALQNQADALSTGVEISVNEQGKIKVDNSSGANDITIAVTSIVPESIAGGGVSANSRFTRAMEALSATLPSGSPGTAFSQSFNAAIHSASIDIFDSLGTKHTLRMEFRKVDVDAFTGSTWSFKLSVPEPATIDTVVPFNEKTGTVRFNNDGSLASFDPPNISFTANNGSAPDQQVAIGLGTANGFDGMTSFDAKSSTSGISQDGFTGGDLVGIRIDQSGTLIGSFSNGRSFGLAQVGMAKFTNNEGLSAEGSNVYVQSANSGDPIIGTAASAGRGFIQSAALEASNVDLSSALTQLIIIQRGYQANGKTITTSDTLLETLLGIKR